MTIPSALYAAVDRFLAEQGLRKTLKAFRREIPPKERTGERLDLVKLHQFYLDSKQHPTALSTEEVNSSQPDNLSRSDSSTGETSKTPKKQDGSHRKKETSSTSGRSDETKPLKSVSLSTEKLRRSRKRKRKHKKGAEEAENISESVSKRPQNGVKETTIKEEEISQTQEKKSDGINVDTERSTNQKRDIDFNKRIKLEDKKTKKFFQRIDPQSVKYENDRLKDNSFHATFKPDSWGAKANSALKIVKGKAFRHQKNKFKKANYSGGRIELGVNSVKFEYSDDEN